MSTVGITGFEGFLGWHLRAYLHALPEFTVLGAGRSTFQDRQRLKEFVRRSDTIIHLAGINRGEEKDIEQTNVTLTEQLIQACEVSNSKPHVVFANSIQCEKDAAYGRSKKACAELLKQWATESGAMFANLILPNVFGEGGRPFYNSVVSTFCFQLAAGQQPQIIEDQCLEFVHAQSVAREVVATVHASSSGDVLVKGDRVLVTEVLSRLMEMSRCYRDQLIPDVSEDLNLDLFNTYRSYLFPGHYPVRMALRADARGHLFEAVKSCRGGQTFLSVTKPGVTRGNHYHKRKIERFLVVAGRALIRVRRLFSEETTEFSVSGEVPQYVDMPTFHTHNITNVGSEDLITLFWANEIFDPKHPDTVREPV